MPAIAACGSVTTVTVYPAGPSIDVGRLDGQDPTARHRVAGVGGEIHQGLFEGAALGAYRRDIGVGGDVELDVFAEGTAEQLPYVVEQVGDRDSHHPAAAP